MPVFNEERYIAQAIESVLNQKVNFPVEIIIIDDCSTDNTSEIIRDYSNQYSNVKMLTNDRNYGKGYSFKKAHDIAAGKYFHVLDGDDIFISRDKLQKQVDFLDRNTKFIGVAHNSIIFQDKNNVVFVRSSPHSQDYGYSECIENQFYGHTSSFMYRKIVDELPAEFSQEEMRGDTAIFLYHVLKSKKGVMCFSDIWSVYNFHGGGLWSSMSQGEKDKFNKRILVTFQDSIIADHNSAEHAIFEKRIFALASRSQDVRYIRDKATNLNDILTFCHRTSARIYEPKIRQVVFRGMNSFRLVDQLCEAVGKLIVFQKGYLVNKRTFDESRVAVLVSGLVPSGGGVFQEIKELVNILLDRNFAVDILSSNMVATPIEIFNEHFDHPKIRIWQVTPEDTLLDKLESLIRELHNLAPAKIFPFISHHDVVLGASLQPGLGREIVLDFVFDHGLSLGVYNSSIDKILVKTVSQASALAGIVSIEKLRLTPPFLTDMYHRNPFLPLKNKCMTTASAAARSYKVESDYRYSYSEIIPKLLKITGGIHYHYGPLTADFKRRMIRSVKRFGVDPNKFVHIEWADKFGNSLLENGVDLFLSPFPICSARIAVEVMSCGIPSINHNDRNATLPQAIDFVDPNQMTWDTPRELFENISSLTTDDLSRLSASARSYYKKNNETSVASRWLLEESRKPFTVSNAPLFALNDLMDSGLVKVRNSVLNRLSTDRSNGDNFWRRTKFRRKIRKTYRRLAQIQL